MAKEAQFSLGTKRKYVRRSSRTEFAFANHHAHKTAVSALAIPKTGLGDFKLPVNSNEKPHHSAAAKILFKNKPRLDHDHDHGEAKKSADANSVRKADAII
ncbi:uncharacterized protein LOC114916118 [Cajanus cajan]|uniref:uncharacterized protein LOC114916118 n=1 Tax=Cajanus cajan TaxID=3821 RepID=UPI0010FBBB69|nr:uncharacterized protein LOC114916118 [Cajanus cajan]